MNAALRLLLIGVASLTAAVQTVAGEGGDLLAPGSTPHWAQQALDEALAASREIPDSFHRAQSLAEIADACVATGQNDLALSLLHDASALTGKIDSSAIASWARHDVALAYVKAGDLAGAEATASAITDLRLRDDVIAGMVDAHNANREFSTAKTYARRMHSAARQARALRSVAIMQASSGDVENALVTARSIGDSTAGDMALGDIATSLAKDGSFRDARLIVARIRDDPIRGDASMEIVAAQARSGDITGAQATAVAIDDGLSRAQALARIGAARIQRGSENAGSELFSQAVQLVKNSRGSPEHKGFAFVEISRACSSVRDIEGAKRALQLALESSEKVTDGSGRLSLIAQIAPMQARVGDHVSAMRTALRADDPSLRPLLIRDVAASQAEAGDVEGAVRAAGTLDDPASGAAAFFGILRVQSRANDSAGMQSTIEEALRTVRLIRSDELKAAALGSLAAAQLAAGDREAAQVLYDEAMAIAADAEAGPARVGAFARIADALGEHGR